MVQTLGTVSVGTVVKINESGKPINYIVVNQGLPSAMYDSSCNGTWVLRQDIYKLDAWDTNNYNALSGSDIISDMADMLSLYDSFIQSSIKTVKIPYCEGGGTPHIHSGGSGLQCQIFPLSGYEIGFTNSVSPDLPIDGAVLSYFNGTNNTGKDPKRIFDYNNSPTQWWLRSPFLNKNNVSVNVTVSGGFSTNSSDTYLGIIPAFILPQNLYVENDGSVVLYHSPSSITVPSVTMQGQPITVSWSSVSGADRYILQRNADNGGWTQVYAGPLTTFTDTAGTWSTVQYQVCGVFSGTNGAFAQSDSITVVAASALVISGQDGDLGTITNDIPYSVNSDTSNDITLVRTVNGAQVATATVQTGFSYNIPVLDLPTGTNTIVITATVTASSGQVTATRTWTYTKTAASFPASGGVAALSQDGHPIFPQTLAEAVKAIGGPWGGNLSSALNKLALAATYAATPIPKYSQVDVNLATAQSGDIINLPVNGVMVPHIVVQVGNPDPSMYDSSCDGVWLLRQDIVENGQWNSTNVNTLAGSTIMSTMAGYVTDYDPTVQAAIQTVKIPYCVGGGDTTVKTLADGLECKMFPLSAYEVGWSDSDNSNFPIDGHVLEYFENTLTIDIKRIAYRNGLPVSWSLRSINKNTEDLYFFCNGNGNYGNGYVANTDTLRHCFLLPTTFTATYYVDESGNVHPSQEYTTAGDFYDLWGNIIPTVKIATGNYTGTGTYGSSNPNTLTFSFEPKIVFVIPLGSNNNGPGILYPAFYTEAYISYAYISQSSVSGVATLTQAFENYANLVGKTVSWYAASNTAQKQLNISGAKYYYIAIG